MLMLKIFKIVAFLEGVSYILLMTMGLFFKYILANDLYVKLLGMPHGVLFIIYVCLAVLLRKQQDWNNKDFIIIQLASLVPFGTFYVDNKYLRNK